MIKNISTKDEFVEKDPEDLDRISIELRVKTLQTIDTKRGIVKRSPYLRQLIEKHIADAPTYPPEEEF